MSDIIESPPRPSDQARRRGARDKGRQPDSLCVRFDGRDRWPNNRMAKAIGRGKDDAAAAAHCKHRRFHGAWMLPPCSPARRESHNATVHCRAGVRSATPRSLSSCFQARGAHASGARRRHRRSPEVLSRETLVVVTVVPPAATDQRLTAGGAPRMSSGLGRLLLFFLCTLPCNRAPSRCEATRT